MAGVRLAARQGAVLHDAAHDDGVADHGQRLRMGEPRPVDGPSEAAAQVHRAVGPEVGVQAAGAGVHGHQQQVVGGDEDAGVAALVVLPVRHPAVLPAHVGRPFEAVVGARVVRPDQLAGARVEGRDLPEGGADVDQPADHQRRGLEGAGADGLVLGRDLARDRAPPPRDLQLGEVLGRDLVERRVLGVGGVRPERPPFADWRPGLPRGRHRRADRHCERRRTRRPTAWSRTSHLLPPVDLQAWIDIIYVCLDEISDILGVFLP